MKRQFLDTPYGQIHYAAEGSGNPVVLLHQSPRSIDEYAEVMPLLAEKYWIIAMDTLGYGASDKPSEQPSLADYGKTVIMLLDKLGIKGYTLWENVQGRGTNTGVPHLATHTWPEINKSLLTVVNDEVVDSVLDKIKKIDSINEEVGIRAFVWDVVKSV